ncbi:MAG: PIN domain-containing protein [Anaerolineae bacterium]|nr:PIN domain-containing protein [Anaerolineae bacterium]
MKVLLDTNVVLDVLLNREPWSQYASQIWQAIDDGKIAGYISACTLTDIFYIARKLSGREKAILAVQLCLDTFVVCLVDQQVLIGALNLSGPDFEDNVQVAGAVYAEIDYIITRDPAGFAGVAIPAIGPDEFVTGHLNS